MATEAPTSSAVDPAEILANAGRTLEACFARAARPLGGAMVAAIVRSALARTIARHPALQSVRLTSEGFDLRALRDGTHAAAELRAGTAALVEATRTALRVASAGVVDGPPSGNGNDGATARLSALFALNRGLARTRDADGAARVALETVGAATGAAVAALIGDFSGGAGVQSAAADGAPAGVVARAAARATALLARELEPAGSCDGAEPEPVGAGWCVALPLAVDEAAPFGLSLWAGTTPLGDDELALLAAATDALAATLARRRADAGSDGTMRHELLAVISHDLRNPLSAIMMSAALLLRGKHGAPPEGQRQLEVIKRSAERMNQLIQNLLDAAQIEAGTLAVDPAPHEVATLVADGVRLLHAAAANKSVALETDTSAATCAARVDREKLVQAIANVATVAVRFATRGGAVRVRARRAGAHIEFAVVDGGPGLALDDLPRVFDRGWWLSRNAGIGTGLGLAVARGIVEAHGGRMWASRDEALGPGTTFYFTVPAIEP